MSDATDTPTTLHRGTMTDVRAAVSAPPVPEVDPTVAGLVQVLQQAQAREVQLTIANVAVSRQLTAANARLAALEAASSPSTPG